MCSAKLTLVIEMVGTNMQVTHVNGLYSVHFYMGTDCTQE